MDVISDPQLPADDEVKIRNTSFKKPSSIDSSPLLTMCCSDGSIHIHQKAIASLSPHFGIFSIGKEVILQMTDINTIDFEAIKDLSLSGQCVVKRQNLKSLEKAAERLGMKKLRDIVSRIIAAESVPVFTVKIWNYEEKSATESVIKIESDNEDENPNPDHQRCVENEDGDNDEEMDDLFEDEIVWGDNDEPLPGPSHRQNSKEEEVARSTVSSSQNSEGAEQCPTNGEQSEMTPNGNRNVPDISRCETPELRPRRRKRMHWPHDEINTLISICSENFYRNNNSHVKLDDIYPLFTANGYQRSPKQIREKWRQLQRKQVQLSGNSRGFINMI